MVIISTGVMLMKMLLSLSEDCSVSLTRKSVAVKMASSFVNLSFSLWSYIFNFAAIYIFRMLIVSSTKVAAVVCCAFSVSRYYFSCNASLRQMIVSCILSWHLSCSIKSFECPFKEANNVS